MTRSAILGDAPTNTEQKLQALSREQTLFYAWTSTKLGDLLGVDGAAIRKLHWWKVERRDYLKRQREDNELSGYDEQ